MEGGSIPLHLRRCSHSSLKSNDAFNSVLIIKLSKGWRYHPLYRASSSALVPPNHLEANMLSQMHETCHQGCGVILVESFIEGNSQFHCHLVVTLTFPIWIMPRSLHSCFTCVHHNKLVVSIISLLQMWRRNRKWNAVISKHFCSLANSN